MPAPDRPLPRPQSGVTPRPCSVPAGAFYVLMKHIARLASQRVCPCRIETDRLLPGSPVCFWEGFFIVFSLSPLSPLRLPRSLFPFLYPRTKRNFKKDLNVISESNIYDGRKRVGKTTSGCENGHGKGGRNDSTAPGRVPLPGPWGCERPGGL